jgi:hypothetical protein
LVIPANSYLQWDTALPTTGFLLRTKGVSSARMSQAIEFVIVDSMDAEVVALRMSAADTITIRADSTDVDLRLDRDQFGSPGSSILSAFTAFHELMITQLAVQSRRYSADDLFYYYGSTLYWDDGSIRERVSDAQFSLSRRMADVLPAGCKARIVNTSGSNITVAYWRADKTPDLIESDHLSCDEKRQVCLLVNDNHVQKWELDTAGFTWEDVSLRSVDSARSTNCAYYEQSDYGTPGDVPPDFNSTAGTVSQEYYRDRYFYSYRNYEKFSPIGSISYVPPSSPLTLGTFYNLNVVPKSHPSDSTKLLLDITLNLNLAGLIYDGTPPGPSNVEITAPGATITATVTNEVVSDNSYVPSLISTSASPTGQAWTGQCWDTRLTPDADPGFGNSVDSFRTQALTSSTRQRYKWSDDAGVYWIESLNVSLVWTDVEVSKWGGSSPTVVLSSADATITINSTNLSSLDEDEIYIYDSSSTELSSSSTPFDYDSYTSQLANPYGAFVGQVVAGSGNCPLDTGSTAVSFLVVTETVMKRVDWTNMSVTINGST